MSRDEPRSRTIAALCWLAAVLVLVGVAVAIAYARSEATEFELHSPWIPISIAIALAAILFGLWSWSAARKDARRRRVLRGEGGEVLAGFRRLTAHAERAVDGTGRHHGRRRAGSG